MSEVALITAYNPQGELLLGRRLDNDLWTLPGGHLNGGEDPAAGALRELFEETGLHAHSLSFLKDYVSAAGVRLHCFSAFVTGKPHGNNDPDQEVEDWEFVDVSEGIPPRIWDHLHGPAGDDHFVRQMFEGEGLHKAERDLPKTETCARCSKPAVARAIWAEGMAYQPTCEEHKPYFKEKFGDEFCNFRPMEKFDSEVWATYRFESEEAAQAFRRKCQSKYEDDWKGIGVSFIDGSRVKVRAWDQRNQDKFRDLADEMGAKMAKAEVDRFLAHPDTTERLIALKLDSVTPQDLQRASLDPDPSVHQAAIQHKNFGPAEGLNLMESSQGLDGSYPLMQQACFLAAHDRVEPYHLAAVLRTGRGEPSVAEMVANHPRATEPILRSMYLDPAVPAIQRLDILHHHNAPGDVLEHALNMGMMVPGDGAAADLARTAAAHPRMSLESLLKLARLAADRGDPHLVAIAEHALAAGASIPTPAVAELFRELLPKAIVKPTSAAPKLVAALLKNPNSSPSLTAEAVRALPAGALQAAPPAATAQDLSILVGRAASAGDAAGLAKMMEHPAFGSKHLEQLLRKTMPLEKAVKPEHFGSIVRASDPHGSMLVDHKPDLDSHPGSHGAHVEAYKNNVLEHPEPVGPHRGSVTPGSGVSRKRVFRAAVAGQDEPAKFMVKPYHERVVRRAKSWMRFPIQGWAEMTNQALYHAGGIGDLHQKVHVAEHDMGPGHEREPALVVNLEPKHVAVGEGGEKYFKPEHDIDVRKIAMMDFLSGNHDRHGGNLLFGKDTGKPLAVDHSRSFQYVAPSPGFGMARGPGEDVFGAYVQHNALTDVAPTATKSWQHPTHQEHYDAQLANLRKYAPAFQWWGEVGDKVRKTFNDRLDQIKDPGVREHLRRNFSARANWLDERAKFGLENFGTDWYHDPVALHGAPKTWVGEP